MTASELKRFLKSQGCTFEDATNHTAVILGTRRAMLPRHPSQEIKTGTFIAILKQLGIANPKRNK